MTATTTTATTTAAAAVATTNTTSDRQSFMCCYASRFRHGASSPRLESHTLVMGSNLGPDTISVIFSVIYASLKF